MYECSFACGLYLRLRRWLTKNNLLQFQEFLYYFKSVGRGLADVAAADSVYGQQNKKYNVHLQMYDMLCPSPVRSHPI